MIILDTDALSIIQRRAGREYERLVNHLRSANGEPICVTIVSFEEQMRGWLAWVARAKTPERQIAGYVRLRALLDDFQTRPVLDYEARAAAEFQRLVKSRIRIGTMDLRIAATALVHNATLVSRNLADFRKVPRLRVEDWTTL